MQQKDNDERMLLLRKHLKLNMDTWVRDSDVERYYEVVTESHHKNPNKDNMVSQKLVGEYMIFTKDELVEVDGYFIYKVPGS